MIENIFVVQATIDLGVMSCVLITSRHQNAAFLFISFHIFKANDSEMKQTYFAVNFIRMDKRVLKS